MVEDNVVLLLKLNRDKVLLTEYYIDKSIEKLDDDISNIYHYIFEYGIDSIGGNLSQDALMSRKEFFMDKVHEGLRLAQDKIIDMLLNINLESDSLKNQLKQANIDRNKELIRDLSLRLQDLSNREYIIRKLADTIAWAYITRNHPTSRRLYIGRNMDSIKNSDIETYLTFADKYSEENKLSFCFLTDITTFIQIGDVICLRIDKNFVRHWNLVEVKTGDTNYKILNILNGEVTDDIMHSLTIKEFKQRLRILDQMKRMQRACSTINYEKGIDAKGEHICVFDAEHIEIKYYNDIISKMFKGCGKKGWSVEVIEDCLYLGAYDINIPIQLAYYAFNEWMKNIDVRYPITNFQMAFKCPVCKPPFLAEVDKTDILDIALGKKVLLASLDFDKWFEMGEGIGLNCRWLSRKESDKYTKKVKNLASYDHKLINISIDGWNFIVGDAVPARIFF